MTAEGSPAPHPAAGSPVVWPAAQRRAVSFPRSDLRVAAGVLSAVALLGLPLALLWSRLAPAQLSVVQDDGTFAALPPESQHRFDDLALFALLGLATGVLTAVAVWSMRRRRGPLVLLGLAAGSLLAAWLAMRTGLWLVDGRYGGAARAAAPNSVVAVAPRLESVWVLAAQPLAALLTYGVAAATNGLDDLGRGPS